MPVKRRNTLRDNNLRSMHKFGIAFAKELLPEVTTRS